MNIEQKKQEVDKLAKSIELLRTSIKSKETVEQVEYLFTELQEKMYEIDCQFLDLKHRYFQKVYNKIKEDVDPGGSKKD